MSKSEPGASSPRPKPPTAASATSSSSTSVMDKAPRKSSASLLSLAFDLSRRSRVPT